MLALYAEAVMFLITLKDGVYKFCSFTAQAGSHHHPNPSDILFFCFPSCTLKETSDLGARVNDCRTLKYDAGQRKRGKQVYFTQEIWIIKGGRNESQLNGEPLKANRMKEGAEML